MKVCETCLGTGKVKSLLTAIGERDCPNCLGSGGVWEITVVPVTEGDTQIFPVLDGITLSEDEMKLIRLLRKGNFDRVQNFIRKLEIAIEEGATNE